MTMKNYRPFIWLICCTLICHWTFGQSELEKYKAEFPKAPLVKLLDQRKVTINIAEGDLEVFDATTERHLLLNKNAAGFAERSIQYSDFFDLVDIEARTRVPDGRRYKVHEVTDFETSEVLSERNFYDGRKSTSFVYDHARPGARLELEYTEKLSDARFVHPYYFSSFYDTEKAVFEVDVDADVNLEIKTYNDPDKKIQYESTSRKGRVFHRWTLENIIPFEAESSAPSFRSLSPSVAVRVKSFASDGKDKPVLRDVGDLFNWYSSWINSIKNEAVSNDIKAVVDSIKVGANSEKMLVNGVYDWVKSNIKYLAIENNMEGFIPRDPNTIYQQKFGDCKDMSCMIVNMLDHAGVESHFTWIGTRDIAIDYEDFPAPFIDNHMIATYVTPEGEHWFLDATDEYLPLGYPSEFIQGKQALIYKNAEDYELQMVPESSPQNSQVIDSAKLRIEGELLLGSSTTHYSGYNNGKYRRQYNKMKGEDPEKFFKYYHERGNNKFLIQEYGQPEFSDSMSIVTFDFEIDDYLSRTDDKIFVNLNLEKVLGGQKIEEDRKQPIEQDFCYSLSHNFELTIPEGYEIEFLPEDFEFSNDLLDVSINYLGEKDRVSYSFRLDNKSLLILPQQFESWNQVVKKLKKHYRAVVTLKKKV